jgi:hypothetical protein
MTTSTKKTHYEVLGVAHDALLDEIHAAFITMSQLYYPTPDGGGNEATFKEISDAWAVLRDPKRREDYDNELADNFEAGEDLQDAEFTRLREPPPDPDDDPLGFEGPPRAGYAGASSSYARASAAFVPPRTYQQPVGPPLWKPAVKTPYPFPWRWQFDPVQKVLLSVFGAGILAIVILIVVIVGPYNLWEVWIYFIHFIGWVFWAVGRILHAFSVAFGNAKPSAKH